MGVDFSQVKLVIHFGPVKTDRQCATSRKGWKTFPASIQYYSLPRQTFKPVLTCYEVSHQEKNYVLENSFGAISHMMPLHNCCSRCHTSCTCEGEQFSNPYFNFNQMTDISLEEENQRTLEVCNEDKQCLKEALQEVRLSLDLSSWVTLFD